MVASDTIFALASGAPPSGIAVIRLSGAKATDALRNLADRPFDAGLHGPVALRGAKDMTIDEGLVLVFRAPRSFTGEDVVELQVHGSRAVIESVTERLIELGLREAEPGEFTRRAFENGRMDLTEIEGLSDLLAAQTELQRRAALAQQGGALRHLYDSWADRLLQLRAMIEAELDFADEEDVPNDAASGTHIGVRTLIDEMEGHLAFGRDGEIVREGFRVALLGPPNAGKSSLLNALADRDAAIVTDVPGTTRDVVEVVVQRNGMAVVFTDTAGFRATDDVVELEGIARAQRAAEQADLRIWLSPSGASAEPSVDAEPFTSKDDDGRIKGPSVSTRRDDGLADLWSLIDERLGRFGTVTSGPAVWPTRTRHRIGVADALRSLNFGLDTHEPELQAEHLRAAHHAISRITGRVDVEDLLGVIFSEFCVGK